MGEDGQNAAQFPGRWRLGANRAGSRLKKKSASQDGAEALWWVFDEISHECTNSASRELKLHLDSVLKHCSEVSKLAIPSFKTLSSKFYRVVRILHLIKWLAAT
ncbi:hypothetical protein [Pantoea agglomerans]|uniref:hypothetical protein n=1 Tax=Enterobacter agglomerans TaxID=549 RepID=UPI00144255BE|nr:hypothetical protein [Pantoea agglomerans]